MDEQTIEHTDIVTSQAFDSHTVRELERPLLEEGMPLMRMAATAAAKSIMNVIEEEGWDESSLRICVLAGSGDNGGDGLFAGAMLAAEGYNVTTIAVGKTLHDEAYAAFLESGGHVYVLDPASHIPGCPTGFSSGEAGQRLEHAITFIANAHIIIDAMTGIGIHGALHGIPAAIASEIGLTKKAPQRIGIPDDELAIDFPFVVAMDTPSGVGVDDGSIPGAYIPADLTMMFGALKPCAVLPPASLACGKVNLVDFGFDIDDVESAVEVVNQEHAQMAMRVPLVNDAKYSRGVVGLITGSHSYPGAAVLSTRAAARSNVGMVRYLGPQRAQDLVLQALPEAVIGKGHVQSWVVGCGVPDKQHADSQDIQRQTIKTLLAHYAISDDLDEDTAANHMPPIVVDAGALDLLPQHVPAQVVITPHTGEMSRLLTRIDTAVSEEEVLSNPLYYAQRVCTLTGATVVLKGAFTVIVGVDNKQKNGALRTLVCGRAPAFVSTAGAGDVLAGIIGAFLAQQADSLEHHAMSVIEIVAGAIYLHGTAAAIASHSDHHAWHTPLLYGEAQLQHEPNECGHPIVASDVIDAIPSAFDVLNIIDQYAQL